jgi:hypothetical protein
MEYTVSLIANLVQYLMKRNRLEIGFMFLLQLLGIDRFNTLSMRTPLLILERWRWNMSSTSWSINGLTQSQTIFFWIMSTIVSYEKQSTYSMNNISKRIFHYLDSPASQDHSEYAVLLPLCEPCLFVSMLNESFFFHLLFLSLSIKYPLVTSHA